MLLLMAWAQEGRIAFITPDGQLATVAPNGHDLRQLSQGDQRLQFPAWSPDGEQIAVIGADRLGGFASLYQDSQTGEASEIYRNVTEGPFYLYWSPDSSQLALLANNPAGIGLHLAAENRDSELLSVGSPFYWQWLASGEGMLIHAGNGPQTRTGLITTQDDSLSPDLSDFGLFQAPGISPTGDYIAYATGNPGRGDQRVVLMTFPGSSDEIKREVPHVGVAAISWSPAEDRLAIMSPASPAANYFGPIQLLDAATGDLTPLTENRALAFFWSPDGRYVAYLSASQASDSEFAGAEPVQAANYSLVQNRQVQNRLLLNLNLITLSTGEDEQLATFQPSLQFVRQFLPFFDQYALSHSLWSPSSDALVLPAVTEAGPQLVVFALDGSVTPIAEGDMGFWSR